MAGQCSRYRRRQTAQASTNDDDIQRNGSSVWSLFIPHLSVLWFPFLCMDLFLHVRALSDVFTRVCVLLIIATVREGGLYFQGPSDAFQSQFGSVLFWCNLERIWQWPASRHLIIRGQTMNCIGKPSKI